MKKFFSYSQMFDKIFIIGIFFPILVLTSENPTESIVDFYNKINAYGSLPKATSFDLHTQSKLKFINTVRMTTYKSLLIIFKNICRTKEYLFSSYEQSNNNWFTNKKEFQRTNCLNRIAM